MKYGNLTFWLFLCFVMSGILSGAEAYEITVSDLDRYKFNLERTSTGFVLAPKYFVDEVDPNIRPKETGGKVEGFAARNEWQSAGFVIYATEDLNNVHISISDLQGPGDNILSSEIMRIRLNRRVKQRLAPRVPWDNVVTRAALLEPANTFGLPAGHFKEVTITFQIPSNQKEGVYQGKVEVSSAQGQSASLPVEIEVLPFRLKPSKKKQYGMYYHSMSMRQKDRERVLAALRDMREHYVNHLYGYFGIRFIEEDGNFVPVYDELKKGLELMREAGFTGSAIVRSGMTRLDSKLVEEKLLTADSNQWPEDKLEALYRGAEQAMKGLEAIKKEYPDIGIIVTHMDEVFRQERFVRYARLTDAIRKANPKQQVYITLHNIPRSWTREMLNRIDPYVDVRGYNGHGLELWIQGNHKFKRLAQEMKKTGDTAWMYHNPNRPYYVAKWSRIINGLFMWWAPVKVHIPFRYRTIREQPFKFIHNMGYTIASPEDGVTPIALRNWEAFRLGAQDVFYFAMLEELVNKAREKKLKEAARASLWLNKIQWLCPRAEDIQEMDNNRSPLIEKVAERLDGKELERIRHHTAELIINLRESLSIKD